MIRFLVFFVVVYLDYIHILMSIQSFHIYFILNDVIGVFIGYI